MEICGALCYEVVILVVAQQKVDTRVFLDVNLEDCCHVGFREKPRGMLTPSFGWYRTGTSAPATNWQGLRYLYLRTLQGPPAFVYS